MSKLLKQIVVAELEDLAKRISENIKESGQWASGNTARSLKVRDEGGGVYVLYGRNSFDSLEKGYKGRVSPKRIYDWIVAKGIAKPDPRETLSFAFRIARKIESEGTFLYRNKATYDGVVPDVYSSEVIKTVENLYDKIGEYAIKKIETITLNL